MTRLEALAQAIKEVRLERHLSQEKLAEFAKLHRNSMSLIERNQIIPTMDSIFAIADALEISASALVARAEEIFDKGSK